MCYFLGLKNKTGHPTPETVTTTPATAPLLPPESRATPCPKRHPPRPTVRSSVPVNTRQQLPLRGGPPSKCHLTAIVAVLS